MLRWERIWLAEAAAVDVASGFGGGGARRPHEPCESWLPGDPLIEFVCRCGLGLGSKWFHAASGMSHSGWPRARAMVGGRIGSPKVGEDRAHRAGVDDEADDAHWRLTGRFRGDRERRELARFRTIARPQSPLHKGIGRVALQPRESRPLTFPCTASAPARCWRARRGSRPRTRSCRGQGRSRGWRSGSPGGSSARP
jgi:hypothetical protein